MSGKSITHRPKSHLQNQRRLAAYGIKHSSNFSKSNLLVVVLAFGAIGSYFLLTSSAASFSKVWDTDTDLNGSVLTSTTVSGSGTAAKLQLSTQTTSSTAANLWIDTTGGSCTRQATAGAYNDAQACSSIQTALAACTPGDTIHMKGGTYGAQTVTASKGSPGCVVTADTSPTTTIGELTVSGSNYELDNLFTSGIGNGGNMNAITLVNMDIGGNGGVDINAGTNQTVTNVTFRGGKLHDFSCSSCSSAFSVFTNGDSSAAGGGGGATLSNFTIDGMTFQNVVNTGSTSNHFEVIRVDGAINGFNLLNSQFPAGNVTSTSTIFFTNFRGDKGDPTGLIKPKNILLQNNYFGDNGPAFNAIDQNYQTTATCDNFTFNYNTFMDGGIAQQLAECQNTYNNYVWVGNILPTGDCIAQMSYSNNVEYGTGSKCGASDTVTTSAALNLSADNFHINSGSSVIDKGGTGANCISTDIDGGARPQGSACDAGADEFGAGAPSPGTYNPSGTAVYSFDVGQSASWTNLTDSQTTPAGTTATLDARSSSDNSNWSGWVSAANIATLAANRYIQVRATLNTTDTSQTPSIDSISLGYATGTVSGVPGDTNNDGHVDIFDLSIFISNYGTSTASCDFNHDGTVNVLDLSTLISNYGT